MGHEPRAIDRVPVVAAPDVIVDPAAGHRLERGGDQAERLGAGLAGGALEGSGAEQEGELRRAGKLGGAPEAAMFGVEALDRLAERRVKGDARPLEQRLLLPLGRRGLRGEVAADRLQCPVALRQQVGPVLPPALAERLEHARKTRPGRQVLGRKIGPAVERLQVRREPHAQRPAPAPRHRLDVGHVDLVDIRALLAVDLHRDEVGVEEGGDLRVVEALVRHHVAPVAGGVADAEEDRPVLGAGAGEGGLAPRQPLDRLVGVLEEVGGFFGGEGVGHRGPHGGTGPAGPQRHSAARAAV